MEKPEDLFDVSDRLRDVSDQLRLKVGAPGPVPKTPDQAGGQYLFADLAELDGVIAEWQDLITAIDQDQRQIIDALAGPRQAAADGVSDANSSRTVAVLDGMREHNMTLLQYADAYVEKLVAARAAMASTEETNEARITAVGIGETAR